MVLEHHCPDLGLCHFSVNLFSVNHEDWMIPYATGYSVWKLLILIVCGCFQVCVGDCA